jgi:hypothetical protein
VADGIWSIVYYNTILGRIDLQIGKIAGNENGKIAGNEKL